MENIGSRSVKASGVVVGHRLFLADVGQHQPQALVEAGRQLGARMLMEGGTDDAARLAFGFRAATSRPPRPEELAVLRKMLERFRKDFTADGKGASALLKGTSQDAGQAAYAALGGLLLNLDETLTKN